MNPIWYKWPTNGFEEADTKLVSVLLPPKPMLPRWSNSKIEIVVTPAFDPRNMGYLLSWQLWSEFLTASIAEKVCSPHILSEIDVRLLAYATSLTLNYNYEFGGPIKESIAEIMLIAYESSAEVHTGFDGHSTFEQEVEIGAGQDNFLQI